MEEDLAALTERFRRMDCGDPEGWARSEIDENLPQLARFVFLRELWKLVVPVGDRTWLRSCAVPNDDGRGGAIRRLKESGIDLGDLTAVVREMQAAVLREFVARLDGLPGRHPEVPDVAWGLYELDEQFTPRRAIDALHESVDAPDVLPPPA